MMIDEISKFLKSDDTNICHLCLNLVDNNDPIREIFERLTVSNKVSIRHIQNKYQYLWKGYQEIEDRLYDFFSKIGINDTSDINACIEFILYLKDSICKTYNTKNYDLHIRSFIECDDYDIPNFHLDGGEKESRFCVTLKGPSTLICEADSESKDQLIIFENKCESDFSERENEYGYRDRTIEYTHEDYCKDDDKIRYSERLARNEIVKGFDIIQTETLKGLIFHRGHNSQSLIHSEPKITGSRIFMSIDPIFEMTK